MHGPHLMLDGYDCRQDALNDLNLVYQFLDKLPEVIGMHKITQPYIFRYEGKTLGSAKVQPASEYGITGFVVIAESHISVHTFPAKGYFTIDVYSCKPFDVDAVVRFVQRLFAPKELEKHFLERGHVKKQVLVARR